MAWEERQEAANVDAFVTVASVNDHGTIDRYRGYIKNVKRANGGHASLPRLLSDRQIKMRLLTQYSCGMHVEFSRVLSYLESNW